MVKCESLRINMFRIIHTGKISKFSRNSNQLNTLNAAFFNLPLSDCEAEFESLSLDWLALNKFRSELDERKQDLLTL